MKKNKPYIVIKTVTRGGLQKQVAKYMKLGYVLQGGVEFSLIAGWMQAMVKDV